MDFLFIAFFCIYLAAVFYWNKKVTWRLRPKTSGILKKVHFAALIICIVIAVLYGVFSLGLRGLWTTRIVIIFTLLTGIFFRFILSEASINKIEKLYFKIFSFLPMIMAGTLLIPFMGVLIVSSLIGRLVRPVDDIHYEDDKLRVQSTFQGMLIEPKIDIYKKQSIFEEHLKIPDYNEWDVDYIKVFYDKDSTRVVVHGKNSYDEDKEREPEVISFAPIK